MHLCVQWIPLYRDGELQTGAFHLPILLEHLPHSYSYLKADVNLPNLKWLDNHKPAFQVQLEAVSSLHAQVSGRCVDGVSGGDQVVL